MAAYSTSDLSRKSGDIIAAALRAPVTITQRRKPRLVLLSVEEFDRLCRRGANPRKAHTLETMPDDLYEAAKDALSAYEGEGDTP
jgi:prevent-host-death family protein